MADRPVIHIPSSDEEEDEIQVLAFQKVAQTLIESAPPKVVKKLCEHECPICFDALENATTTTCGHVFCLECLQKSISSSSARGQTRGKKGVGLCPMCRKPVAFKDAIVLRLKVENKVEPPGGANTNTQNSASTPNIANFAGTGSEFPGSGSEFDDSMSRPQTGDSIDTYTNEELQALFGWIDSPE